MGSKPSDGDCSCAATLIACSDVTLFDVTDGAAETAAAEDDVRPGVVDVTLSILSDSDLDS